MHDTEELRSRSRTDRLAILVRHDARELMQVRQVMRRPRRQRSGCQEPRRSSTAGKALAGMMRESLWDTVSSKLCAPG